MGDNNVMDALRHRRPKSARPPVGGDAETRRAEAEQRTANALENLDPNAWTVIDDLQWPGGRYGHVDHVVVGPSGVYVIDTKTWNGDISVYGDQLRHEGIIQDSVVASLADAAAAVALLIPGVPPRLVKAVLCAANAEGLETHVGGLLVCSMDNLVSTLESRVHTMSTHQITRATRQLRENLHDRGLVKVAARAGHKEANRRPFVPMRGVPVIRIAIGVWFASALVLAPHAFIDTATSVHDTVEREVEHQIDRQKQIDQQQRMDRQGP